MNRHEIKRTDVNELGEFGLIDHLTEDASIKRSSTLKSIGDDAAILENQDEVTVVSTDMLVEGIHFDLMYTPLKHLGYKSIVVNLSDICAMNAIPSQVTVSFAISNRFSVEALEELYEGIHLACEGHLIFQGYYMLFLDSVELTEKGEHDKAPNRDGALRK